MSKGAKYEVEVDLRRMLIIAYASGYEHGHQDTVDGCFSGNGRSDYHDSDAGRWLQDALLDGTFERDINI